MIHDEHPFATPPEDRDPVRRFRGRLVSPVTIVTAGHADPVGLTVGSLMVSEGKPSRVLFLCGETTDLWPAIEETGRFVVHILSADQRPMADVFAGIRPQPGGPFKDLETVAGEWGPEITSITTRARCRYELHHEVAQHLVVWGIIDEITVDDVTDPLAYFRGRYRRLGDS